MLSARRPFEVDPYSGRHPGNRPGGEMAPPPPPVPGPQWKHHHPPKDNDFYGPIERGCSLTIPVVVKDQDGNSIDLTGFMVGFTVKSVQYDNDSADASALIQTEFAPQDPESGTFLIELTSAQMNFAPGKYFFDIQVFDSESGLVARLVTMWFDLVGGPTNRFTSDRDDQFKVGQTITAIVLTRGKTLEVKTGAGALNNEIIAVVNNMRDEIDAIMAAAEAGKANSEEALENQKEQIRLLNGIKLLSEKLDNMRNEFLQEKTTLTTKIQQMHTEDHTKFADIINRLSELDSSMDKVETLKDQLEALFQTYTANAVGQLKVVVDSTNETVKKYLFDFDRRFSDIEDIHSMKDRISVLEQTVTTLTMSMKDGDSKLAVELARQDSKIDAVDHKVDAVPPVLESLKKVDEDQQKQIYDLTLRINEFNIPESLERLQNQINVLSDRDEDADHQLNERISNVEVTFRSWTDSLQATYDKYNDEVKKAQEKAEAAVEEARNASFTAVGQAQEAARNSQEAAQEAQKAVDSVREELKEFQKESSEKANQIASDLANLIEKQDKDKQESDQFIDSVRRTIARFDRRLNAVNNKEDIEALQDQLNDFDRRFSRIERAGHFTTFTPRPGEEPGPGPYYPMPGPNGRVQESGYIRPDGTPDPKGNSYNPKKHGFGPNTPPVMAIYETINDVPAVARGAVKKAIASGAVPSYGVNENGDTIYNLSEGMVRALVNMSNNGMFDSSIALQDLDETAEEDAKVIGIDSPDEPVEDFSEGSEDPFEEDNTDSGNILDELINEGTGID